MSKAEKIKVLVVDPEKEIQCFLETLLTNRGFHVFLADGEASLKKILEKDLPDLMIIDALMPGEGALNIFLSLGAHPEYRQIQIIFSSTIPLTTLYYYHKIAGSTTRLGKGPVNHIQKPIQEDELLRVIRGCLKKKTRPGSDRGKHDH